MKLRLFLAAAVLSASTFAAYTQSDALRPALGKPLRAAQQLIKAEKFKEALAKVREADAVPHRSEYESATLERMRISAALGAADMGSAAHAYRALHGEGRLSAAENLQMLEALAGAAYRSKDYARATAWIQRYLRSGGTSPQMRKLRIQSLYLSGDMASAVRELKVEVLASERAGMPPAQEHLHLMLNAAVRQADGAATMYVLEKLLSYYPKREYWAEVLDRVRRKPGFSNRHTLDIYRLMLASASMRSTTDYVEMAQLSLQADLAAEAMAVLNQGFASKVLGQGDQAERHQRLRSLAAKQAQAERAKAPARKAHALAALDGTALVNLGLNYALSGQAAKGVGLIEKGIAKGGLEYPNEAKLHLGQALMLAGRPEKAARVLGTVKGKDGSADLARLWLLLSRREART